jgi:hypothetical protein
VIELVNVGNPRETDQRQILHYFNVLHIGRLLPVEVVGETPKVLLQIELSIEGQHSNVEDEPLEILVRKVFFHCPVLVWNDDRLDPETFVRVFHRLNLSDDWDWNELDLLVLFFNVALVDIVGACEHNVWANQEARTHAGNQLFVNLLSAEDQAHRAKWVLVGLLGEIDGLLFPLPQTLQNIFIVPLEYLGG